jgi:hypothetical protein
MSERTEEEVVSGLLRIAVGGTVKAVPTLKAKYVDDWAKLLTPVGDFKVPREWTMGDVAAMSGGTAARLIDLIVAYDRTAALGGREWLGENADPQELHAAVVQMMGNAFPLADDPAGLLGMMLIQSAVQSEPPSSTKPASTNGASTRKRSARAGIRSS